jgi:ABC-2 type transport system ATP-binding protein
MIKVENIVKVYGDNYAVNNISFSLSEGEVLGFIGPNGAGKSTTMRMMTGFIAPTSGRITLGNDSILSNPENIKKQLGYLPAHAPLYTTMSVIGFLQFCGEARNLSGAVLRKSVDEVIEKCFLKEVKYKIINTLSKGYRQRCCLAQSMLHNPKYLILDEPTDGLDPIQKQEVCRLIKNMGKHSGVMLSTHILDEVDAICDRVIVINNGQIIFEGTPDTLHHHACSNHNLFLTVQGNNENIEQFLQFLEQQSQFKLLSKIEHASDVWGIEVQLIAGEKTRPVLQAELVNVFETLPIELLELHQNSSKLDHVFCNLIKENEKGHRI